MRGRQTREFAGCRVRNPALEALLAAARRRREERGNLCPRCRSSTVIRWGSFSGRHRFRCSGCRRTFSDFTGTPLHYLKKPEKWSDHCATFLGRHSVRGTAARLGVHRHTAFRWRHRLLGPVDASDETRLAGEVSMMETPIRTREKPLRGRAAGTERVSEPVAPGAAGEWLPRWPAGRPVWVLVASARDGVIATVASGVRRPDGNTYERLLGRRFDSDSSILAFGGPPAAARRFAAGRGLPHAAPPVPTALGGAGRYVMWLRHWMKRFRGVSGRFLHHYLAWHRMLAAGAAWPQTVLLERLAMGAFPGWRPG